MTALQNLLKVTKLNLENFEVENNQKKLTNFKTKVAHFGNMLEIFQNFFLIKNG